jgi:gliding motility-associated-like protein
VANASFTQMLCSGDNSVVTVSASGGTPNYTGCGNFTVSSGLYYYTVTDNHDCQASCSVNVPQSPAQLSVNSYTTEVSCFGEDDGAINIVTTGGTPPYTYLWSCACNGANVIDLAPGDYDVVIRDNNGCSFSRSFYIGEPEQIDFNFVTENILCFGANTGKVEMSASGGLPPYSFTVYNQYFTANGPIHSNLGAGDYSVKVTDANGCSVAGNIMILSPSQLELSYVAVSPSCIGNNDGSVEIIASGGTSPYLYTFDQMLFDLPLIGSLKEGVYDLSVLDANNCSREIKSISLTDIEVDCIRIPNAFTPNGDDINDTWQIDNIDRFPDAIINVYNRWGQPVYYARPDEADWDGIYNGKIVPAGAYVYVINLFNGKEPYTGVVSVVH